MSVRTFDFKQVICTVGGVPLSGFSEGTSIEVVRNSPTWSLIVGSDGLVTRSKTNDFSGNLTLTLKQSSPSNDVLSGFLALDEVTNRGLVPILIKDLSGNSVYFSARGWINQYPDSTFGKDITDRSWSLSLDELDLFVGSNAES